MRVYAVALTSVFALLLVGCGGGGGHAGGAQSVIPSVGTTSPPHGSTTQGSATLKITIPSKGATSMVKRRGQYVSVSTTQLKVDVQQSGTSITGYPMTIPLTPTSPGCTGGAGTTVCTIQLSLAVGTYSANFTTEDAGGNALSVATSVALTVVGGTNSPVPVALSGVPASISLASTSALVTGAQATAFAIVGPGAEPFVVNALDADGNVIVGAGAPTLTVTQSGSPVFTVTQPTVAAPNTLSLAAPATYNGGTAQVTVTATYPGVSDACAQSGAVCSATVSFTMQQMIAVLDENPAEVVIYAEGSPTAALATITNAAQPAGMDSPSGFAFDSEGNMYVANSAFGSGNNVAVYAPPYTGTPTIMTTGIDFPSAIAVDKSDNLFVANRGGGTSDNVTEYAPGSTAVSRTFASDIQIESMCTDPSGDAFVAQESGSGIDGVEEYAPGATTATNIANYAFVNKIACDKLGNVYMGQYGLNDDTDTECIGVTKFGPGLTVLAGMGGAVGPNGLSVDNNSTLFIGNSGTGPSSSIAVIPAGSTSPSLTILATAGNFISTPTFMDTDASGNLFYSNDSGGGIYEFLSGQTTITATYPNESSFVAGLTILP